MGVEQVRPPVDDALPAVVGELPRAPVLLAAPQRQRRAVLDQIFGERRPHDLPAKLPQKRVDADRDVVGMGLLRRHADAEAHDPVGPARAAGHAVAELLLRPQLVVERLVDHGLQQVR